jgi:hypothetical protein
VLKKNKMAVLLNLCTFITSKLNTYHAMFKRVVALVFIFFFIDSFSPIHAGEDELFDEIKINNLSLVTKYQQQKIGKGFLQSAKFSWQEQGFVLPQLKGINYSTAITTKAIKDSLIYFDVCPLRNENKTGWQKMKIGAVRITGVEVIGVLIILSLPEKYSKWPPNAIQYARVHVINAYTKPPVMDIDDWPVNYLGHPYAGAAYYNAVRSQGGTVFQSFMLSTFESVLWEYAIEVYSEQPSIQDLLTTSPIGSLLGELAHKATMSMRRDGFTFAEKVITLLINPSFVANNGYNLYKRKPRIRVE